MLALSGCAGQRLPEGGPVDSEPPSIISVFPQPGTVRFDGKSILVEFSEYVDRRSVEEAVFISPGITDKEFEWSGTELEIIFHEELRKNTTYVVTIGTDVRDTRAGNRMTQAFTLSFSTGETIDRGTITGMVFDDKPDGVMLFAYKLDGLRPDTLNPAVTSPDYLTQAGKDGGFLLRNIAPGTYRLFAVRDEYRNFLYEPETDAAGTTDDMTLTEKDTLRAGIHFVIAREDTTPPRLTQVQAQDERHVLVQFSEAMDTSTVTAASFTITDTLMSSALHVTGLFFRNAEGKDLTLITAPQRKEERYLLSANGVKDRSGFVIHPEARTKLFASSSAADTIPPMLFESSVKDGITKIFSDEEVRFTFTDVLQWPLPDTAVTVMRIKDSAMVPIRLSLPAPASVRLRPLTPWNVGEQYQIRFHSGAAADIFGNRGKDSLYRIGFSIDDPENYGSIEGSFAGYPPASALIRAENITDRKQPVRTAGTTATGAFSFLRLPEGKYVLKAFDDVNGNRNHDAGKVFPFLRAERFTYYADTIRVRARWPVDGVIFKAP